MCRERLAHRNRDIAILCFVFVGTVARFNRFRQCFAPQMSRSVATGSANRCLGATCVRHQIASRIVGARCTAGEVSEDIEEDNPNEFANPKPLKIAVLQPGEGDGFKQRCVQKCFGSKGDKWTYIMVNREGCMYPRDIHQFDVYIVPGSNVGGMQRLLIEEKQKWALTLRDFVLEVLANSNSCVLGICWGSQLLASTFGFIPSRLNKTEFGLKPVQPSGNRKPFMLNKAHIYAVTGPMLPVRKTSFLSMKPYTFNPIVLASSMGTEVEFVEAFFSERCLGILGHPEYSYEFMMGARKSMLKARKATAQEIATPSPDLREFSANEQEKRRAFIRNIRASLENGMRGSQCIFPCS